MTTSRHLASVAGEGPISGALEPVLLVHESIHLFSKKKGTKHVCMTCGEHRLHPNHGCFSFNRFGSGADRWTYQKTKKSWAKMWEPKLSELNLPRPCRSIEVFGRISFEAPPPAGKSRDEENYRYPLSKLLADPLEKAGLIANDDWSSFRFRELDLMEVTPGLRRVELMIFPTI